MSVSLAQAVTRAITGNQSNTVTITTTAGNTLIAAVYAENAATGVLHLQSAPDGVIDSAGNTWQYSSAISSQSPPANGQGSGSNYFFGAAAYTVAAAAVAWVTVTVVGFSSPGNVAAHRVTVYEFAGIPATAALDGSASVAGASTGASYTTPSVTRADNAGAAVALFAPVGGINSANTPFVFDSAGAISAYDISGGTGALACTFTAPSSTTVYTSSILSIGFQPATVIPVIRADPQAARRAAFW